MKCGVLALQGDFQAHARVLEALGADVIEVRRVEQLRGLQGLVMPGGESTTMWRFMNHFGFIEALQDFGCHGVVYGSCAGVILLASKVTSPAGDALVGNGLGLLDIDVERNSYGRQAASGIFTAQLTSTESNAETKRIEAILIRAPRIRRIGEDVRVMALLDSDPVWVEQDRGDGYVIGTTFHPELSKDNRVHPRFLELAATRRPY